MLKKALVTGSAVGIGRAIALHLAQQGFDIAVQYNRSQKAAEAACEEALAHSIQAIALQADVTDPGQAQQLVDQAAEQLQGLSVVVNTVGNYVEHLTSQISVDEWHQMIDSNLNATFYVTRAALPHLKTAAWGRIVNFGCTAAQHTMASRHQAAYRLAKAGVIIYTKSLAKEIIEDNITANIISPGVAENSVGLEEITPSLPKGRPASLAEICHAVDFLVSPNSDYITGQIIEVSGGWQL